MSTEIQLYKHQIKCPNEHCDTYIIKKKDLIKVYGDSATQMRFPNNGMLLGCNVCEDYYEVEVGT